MHRTILKGEAGTSIVEMLIALPVIFLLLYGMLELNNRIELAQVSKIGMRNVLSQPVKNDYKYEKDGLKNHLVKQVQDYKGLKDAEVFFDSKSVDTTHRKKRVKAVSFGDDSSFYHTAKLESGFASTYVSTFGVLAENLRAGGGYLFPRDDTFLFEGSVSEKDLSDGIYSSILLAADMAVRNRSPEAADLLAYRASDALYFRPQAGYLETGYKYQALAGGVFAALEVNKKWYTYKGRASKNSKPGKLIPHCIMDFTAGDRCNDRNYLAPILSIVLAIKVVVQTIVSGGGSEMAGLATDMMKDLIDEASGGATDVKKTIAKFGDRAFAGVTGGMDGGNGNLLKFSDGSVANKNIIDPTKITTPTTGVMGK